MVWFDFAWLLYTRLLYYDLCLFCDLVQGQLNCDFSSGPCLWTQDKSDQFDWTRKSGATATVNTGPPSDHTQQSSGKKSLNNPQVKSRLTILR